MLHDLARYLRVSLDPIEFARACGIEQLDDWQSRLLTSTSKRIVINASRQSGKSTTTALMAAFEAIFQAPATIIIISPSQVQSQETFRKIHDFWTQLPDAPRATQENLTRLALENGSRIISLPGGERTIRGYSAVTTIVMDEAARCDDALFAATRPMLATTGGRYIMLSTPRGKRGIFFETWMNSAGWEKIYVAAKDCPRISQEFLDAELAALGPHRFDEEYNGAFLDAQGSAFAEELIEAAFVNNVEPLNLAT